MTKSEIFDVVRRVVADLADDMGIPESELSPETSLVDDVGLDSIKFVDLTVALEDELKIQSFPMQQWADGQLERDGPRFTLGALVDECAAQLGC